VEGGDCEVVDVELSVGFAEGNLVVRDAVVGELKNKGGGGALRRGRYNGVWVVYVCRSIYV